MSIDMKFLPFVLMASFVISCQEHKSQYPTLFPRDESSRDPAFMKLKAAIRQAVDKKNADYIFSILSENVRTSETDAFAGEGPEAFKNNRPLHDKNSNYWILLNKAINIGCVTTKVRGWDGYLCPSYEADFPDSIEIDEARDIIIINGNDIPLHKEPSENSPILTRLSHAILDVKSREKPGWVELKAGVSGIFGYVNVNNTWKCGESLIFFKKYSGVWKLHAFYWEFGN